MINSKRNRNLKLFLGNRLGVVGVIFLSIALLVTIFAPILSPYDPEIRVGAPFERPSSDHLLGTNDVGHDILSEIIYGSRISLSIGVLAAFFSIFIGTIVGIISGYIGGLIESILMRFVDLILVLPFLPLMILLSAFLGPSFWNIILVISILTWARPARIIRSQVLNIKTMGFVEAARATGGSIYYIMSRHILPGVIPLALSQFVLAASMAILIEASLSFLGLGDPLHKSWGTILYYAQARGAFLSDAWLWWVLPPGLCITIVVVGFAFTGYALEEILNPRLRE